MNGADAEVDWEEVLEDVEPDDTEEISDELLHQCRICGKRVRTAIGLRRHTKIHEPTQSGTSNSSNRDQAKQADMAKELPNLVKETMEKMLTSQDYADVPGFEPVLREMIGNFDRWHDGQETADFFKVVSDGMWGAVSSTGLLPHQRRELMWTKFHWFRTNPRTVDAGVKFFSQFVNGNNILKQVLQSMLTQLTVTISIYINRTDAPPTDDAAEALGPMNSAEENALRYIAGWAISKLKQKFANSESEKSKLISATLQNMEDSQDSENFLAHTKNWTAMQNRGGLTTVSDKCFLLFRHIHRIGTSTLNEKTVQAYRGGDSRNDLLKKLWTHTLITKYWQELTPNLCQQWREELFSSVVKLYITLNGHNMVEIYKQRKQLKEHTLLKEQRALRKSLQAASAASST